MAGQNGQLSAVAERLRDLCRDVEMQPVIAREENVMRALVKMIGGAPDAESCAIATDAVRMLASHEDNKMALRLEPRLFEALKNVMLNRKDADKALRNMAFGVYETLTDQINFDESQELMLLQRRLAQRDESEQQQESMSSMSAEERRNEAEWKQMEEGVKARLLAMSESAKTYRIHCVGVSEDAVRTKLERRVMKSAGVMSVTVEIGAEIVEICARRSEQDTLCLVSHCTGCAATVVPAAAVDEESESEEEKARGKKEHDGGPEYIDVERRREREKERKSGAARKPKKTVTHSGGNSLAARLEEQKRAEARKRDRASRFLGGVFSLW